MTYFNPQMFVDQREVADRHLQIVEDFVDDLNRKLRAKRSRRTEQDVQVAVTNKLASLSMLSVYEVEIGTRRSMTAAGRSSRSI